MADVEDLYGVCNAEKCKRPERAITNENDKVTIRKKNYHRECAPTSEELAAQDRSS